VPIGVLLASWFFLSAGFNDVTPRLMKTLESAGGLSIDLTLIELAITVAIAGTKLKVQGARALPPREKLGSLLLVGALHLGACRLFIYGLSLGLPISLAQTIRATNPLFVVVLQVLQGHRHETAVLLTLCPIILGFCLAVSDASSAHLNPKAIASALGSVSCLVGVNSLAQRMATASTAGAPSPGELQCWICEVALTCLMPFWACSGGGTRLGAAFVSPTASRLAGMCALDGAFYFSEQIVQMMAIAMLSPLTLAIVDTVRRLFIVFASGFFLQGNPCTAQNVLGALCVCAGAAVYARIQVGKSGMAGAIQSDAPSVAKAASEPTVPTRTSSPSRAPRSPKRLKPSPKKTPDSSSRAAAARTKKLQELLSKKLD
jgi:solute carrier family 35 protein E1